MMQFSSKATLIEYTIPHEPANQQNLYLRNRKIIKYIISTPMQLKLLGKYTNMLIDSYSNTYKSIIIKLFIYFYPLTL